MVARKCQEVRTSTIMNARKAQPQRPAPRRADDASSLLMFKVSWPLLQRSCHEPLPPSPGTKRYSLQRATCTGRRKEHNEAVCSG